MYLLFAYEGYYPTGGANDYLGGYADLATAKAALFARLRLARSAENRAKNYTDGHIPEPGYAHIAVVRDAQLVQIAHWESNGWGEGSPEGAWKDAEPAPPPAEDCPRCGLSVNRRHTECECPE